MSEKIDFCNQIYLELVRDIRKHSDISITKSLMNPNNKVEILSKRKVFLETLAGKRLLELSDEMDEIIYAEDKVN